MGSRTRRLVAALMCAAVASAGCSGRDSTPDPAPPSPNPATASDTSPIPPDGRPIQPVPKSTAVLGALLEWPGVCQRAGATGLHKAGRAGADVVPREAQGNGNSSAGHALPQSRWAGSLGAGAGGRLR